MSEHSINKNQIEADIAIIGAGPGGYVAAIRAAQLGGKVILIEKDEVGGTCTNRGCIPTKVLLKGAELITQIDKAKNFGVFVDKVSVNIEALMNKKNEVVKRMVKGVQYLLSNNQVETIKGTGKIKGPTEVEVIQSDGSKRIIKTKKLIIATGSKPAEIPIPGIGSPGVISSDEALELKEAPQSLFIIGGGAIGVEFACIFSKLGTKVTVAEMLPHLLPNEDEEIGRLLERVLEKGGIKIITSAKVTEIGDGEMKERKVTVLTEKGKETIYAEKILVAAGRAPNIEGLGLEEIGVAFDRKGIKVNDKMETNIPGVYAIGDVVGKFLLAHVASQEGIVAAENALGGDSRINYKAIPRCIFTIPEVAFTGLSEKQAVEEGFKVKVGRFPFSASGRALTMDEAEGLVKVVADAGTGEILGVHIIGPSATDLIAECVLAINLEATISEIEDTIHAHPTLSEALKEAVLDVDGKAIHIGKKKL